MIAKHREEAPGGVAPAMHELLRRRTSPRAFDAARPVPPLALRAVLEVARWSPSAANRQPWNIVVATREEGPAYERLFNLLSGGNRRWAGSAPVLMLTVATAGADALATGQAFHDVGLATAHLITQATALGLVTHPMGGFDREAARAALGLPEGQEPVAVIALGYPGDPAGLPEDLAAREVAPRVRKPLSEFVHGGRWGTVPALVVDDARGGNPA